MSTWQNPDLFIKRPG